MIEVITIFAITAGAFIGTNLDNLVLLVTFYSRFQQKSQTVTAGYICGMLSIAVLFFVIGKGGDFVPISYLGFFGFIPVTIGILSLIQLFRPKPDEKPVQAALDQGQKALFFAVMMTQLSNGTDTIITFAALLADSTNQFDYIIVPAFLVMVLAFSALARYSLRHRGLSHFLDRFGRYVTPFILILVGWYILSDTATDLIG